MSGIALEWEKVEEIDLEYYVVQRVCDGYTFKYPSDYYNGDTTGVAINVPKATRKTNFIADEYCCAGGGGTWYPGVSTCTDQQWITTAPGQINPYGWRKGGCCGGTSARYTYNEFADTCEGPLMAPGSSSTTNEEIYRAKATHFTWNPNSLEGTNSGKIYHFYVATIDSSGAWSTDRCTDEDWETPEHCCTNTATGLTATWSTTTSEATCISTAGNWYAGTGTGFTPGCCSGDHINKWLDGLTHEHVTVYNPSEPLNITGTLNSENFLLSWEEPTRLSFKVKEYEIRTSSTSVSTWASATAKTTINALNTSWKADWGATANNTATTIDNSNKTKRIWVRAVDVMGNYGEVSYIDYSIDAPYTIGPKASYSHTDLKFDYKDENIDISWQKPTASSSRLPIVFYSLKYARIPIESSYNWSSMRSIGTAGVSAVQGTNWLVKATWGPTVEAGESVAETTRRFVIQAEDSAGNKSLVPTSSAFIDVTPVAPSGIQNITTLSKVVGPDVVLNWEAPSTSSLPIDKYLIRGQADLGGSEDWSSAVEIGRRDSTRFSEKVEWGKGSQLCSSGAGCSYTYPRYTNKKYFIRAVDTAGNLGAVVEYALNVTEPNSVSGFASKVIDNNILFDWDDSSGQTLPIEKYSISRCPDGSTQDSCAFVNANFIGFLEGSFTTYFETAPGDYKYWVVAVDTAGNDSTPKGLVVAVDEPPDFILHNEYDVTFDSSNTKYDAVCTGATASSESACCTAGGGTWVSSPSKCNCGGTTDNSAWIEGSCGSNWQRASAMSLSNIHKLRNVEEAVLPVDTVESWECHFIDPYNTTGTCSTGGHTTCTACRAAGGNFTYSYGGSSYSNSSPYWSNPNQQVTNKTAHPSEPNYTYYAEPGKQTATYWQTFDIGTLLTSLVKMDLNYTVIDGTISLEPQLFGTNDPAKMDQTISDVSGWTAGTVGQYSQYFTNFRYIKVKLTVTTTGTADWNDLIHISNLDIEVTLKFKTESATLIPTYFTGGTAIDGGKGNCINTTTDAEMNKNVNSSSTCTTCHYHEGCCIAGGGTWNSTSPPSCNPNNYYWGKKINFTTPFKDVHTVDIDVYPGGIGRSSWNPIYDFVDKTNPTDMTVFILDDNGYTKSTTGSTDSTKVGFSYTIRGV